MNYTLETKIDKSNYKDIFSRVFDVYEDGEHFIQLMHLHLPLKYQIKEISQMKIKNSDFTFTFYNIESFNAGLMAMIESYIREFCLISCIDDAPGYIKVYQKRYQDRIDKLVSEPSDREENPDVAEILQDIEMLKNFIFEQGTSQLDINTILVDLDKLIEYLKIKELL